MSRRVSETIVLSAPPERVWKTVMDPTRLSAWVTTHDSVEGVEPGAVGEGASFRQRLRLAGKSFRVDWRVVEADAPRLARWHGDGPAGSTARVSYRLEPEARGTRFTYENDFALPGGGLGKLAGGLLAAAPGRSEARRSLERLRAILDEREPRAEEATGASPSGV
jgi:carbon monoxide dehydrogenase subunit G